MKLVAIALALTAVSPPGEASETKSQQLQLRPKAAIVGASSSHRYAPFHAPSGEPELELIPKSHARHEASGYSCSGEHSLCYDPTTRRVVFKPARALMPEIPGLQRENISVRRDRIVFRYSF